MIKFNQPRYILPLIVLPFIYVFFYLYQYTFGKKERTTNQETTSINPELPDPFLDKGNLKDKFDAFLEAHKNNRDFSAMQEIDRREEEPTAQLPDSVQAKPAPVSYTSPLVSTGNQPRIRRKSYMQATPPKQEPSEYEEQMRLFRAQMDYMDSLFSIDRSLQSEDKSSKFNAESSEIDKKANGHREMVGEVKHPIAVEKKGGLNAGHFNTIVKDNTELFIKAMIDQELKVSKDGRIRIRLLEDVVVGEQLIPKGKYLYGVVASFKPQRVEVHISSMLFGDQIIDVALDLYDMDGMKGLYVPESQFRELAKSIGSNMATGQQLNIDNPPDNQMQLMYGLAKDAFNTTSQAAAKVIRKNKARLKYNTMVFLVNTNNTSLNNQQTL